MESLSAVPIEGQRTNAVRLEHTQPCIALVAALAFASLLAGAAHADEPQELARHAADQRCLNCHGQAHIAELAPAERLSMVGTRLEADAPKLRDSSSAVEPRPLVRPELYTPPESFSSQLHAEVTCIECHANAATLPHAPEL